MASFATFSSYLKLNIQDFSNKLKDASKDVQKFSNDLQGKTVAPMKELNKQTGIFGWNMKSISRVTSGIVIAQTFYTILRSVREATNAVWEFTKQLETAQVAYSNLFGSTSLATEFINVLKDFAAKTPFSFTEAEAAAKRLLAYGIEYKNVMYVMQGVLSAASIQGDSAKIESISRALGQIYTYGKLMTQEVRQLSEAGIPAYEILREELGLTQEQLKNLGNEGIPASMAINALVDGIQKRFGTAAEAAALTTTGLISNIKDNATMLFSAMFQPLTNFIKAGLAELGKLLFTLRDLQEVAGTGAVFEYLFPEEMHGVLRQFVANIQSLFQAVARLGYALSGLLGPAVQALLSVFNALAPLLTVVVNIMAGLVQLVTSNATAMKLLAGALAVAATMWVAYRASAIASAVIPAILNATTKALVVMSTMLTFVAAHPFWALFIGLSGILVGATVGFGALGDKVSAFFKKLTQFNGVDPDKVLLPSQKERANDLDKFNDRLEGTSDAMDDLADSTGKATKAAKGLLSFDEVFKLNEPDEGVGDGGIDTDDLGDLMDGLDGLGSGYLPEVPDFGSYFDGLKTNYLQALKDAWNELGLATSDIMSTALGAAFGGLIGKLLGKGLGGVLGGIAGAIVGYFWNQLADYFGLTPDQKIDAGIIGGVGAVLGAVLGGLIGGPLGAKIGAAIGGFVGSFWGIFAEALGVIPEQHIATVVSSAITGALTAGFALLKSFVSNLAMFSGFASTMDILKNTLRVSLGAALKQGAIGAVASLATGILANALTAWLAKEFELTEQDLKNSSVGQTIGSIIGSLVGMILGGPIGSIVGGSLGQLAGAVIGEFWAYMGETLQGAIIGGTAGLSIGAIVGTVVGSIGGPLGAGLGAAVGTALGGLVGLIVEHWDTISNFFTEIGQTIADFFTEIFDFITQFSEIFVILGEDLMSLGSIALEAMVSFVGIITSSFSELFIMLGQIGTDLLTIVSGWFAPIVTAVTTFFTTIWTTVSTWFMTAITSITTWLTNLWITISTWFTNAVTFLTTWFTTLVTNVTTWLANVLAPVVTWFTNLLTNISTWLSGIWTSLSTWFITLVTNVTTWLAGVLAPITAWFNSLVTSITTWLSSVWTSISNWFTTLVGNVTTWLSGVWTSISNWFTTLVSNITTWLSSVWTTISGWTYTTSTNISSWLENSAKGILGWFARLLNSIGDWFSGLWDSLTGWLGDIGDKVSSWWDGLWSDKSASVDVNGSVTTSGTKTGHATGGVFNREHIARFAEGNKAEAIIPLEEASAMQPFVNAVADGLTASLAPLFANMSGGSTNQLQPLYVGTLIADDRSLKELERKMEVIRLQERKR